MTTTAPPETAPAPQGEYPSNAPPPMDNAEVDWFSKLCKVGKTAFDGVGSAVGKSVMGVVGAPLGLANAVVKGANAAGDFSRGDYYKAATGGIDALSTGASAFAGLPGMGAADKAIGGYAGAINGAVKIGDGLADAVLDKGYGGQTMAGVEKIFDGGAGVIGGIGNITGNTQMAAAGTIGSAALALGKYIAPAVFGGMTKTGASEQDVPTDAAGAEQPFAPTSGSRTFDTIIGHGGDAAIDTSGVAKALGGGTLGTIGEAVATQAALPINIFKSMGVTGAALLGKLDDII